MKAKGRLEKVVELPVLEEATQVDESTVMDCDFCGEPMDFATYSTHQCPGLKGLNPWNEKLKRSNWKIPAELKAKGHAISPEAVFNPDKKRDRMLKFFVATVYVLIVSGIAFIGYLAGRLYG